MLGMGDMFGMGNMLGGSNVISQLFSGTNSIFSGFNMYGISGYGSGGCGLFMDCKGNYNYDAMAGFAVGGALLNVAGAAISSAIENKKENSVENLDTKVEEAQEEVNTKRDEHSTKEDELKTLNDKTKELETASTAATDKYNTANNYLAQNKTDYNNAIKKRNNNETLSETEKNIINNYEAYEKQLTGLKSAKEIAEAELKAHNEAVAKKQAEVKEAEEELKAAQAELKAAQEALREAQFDELDGNKLNRVSDKKYNAKFKTNENGEATSEFEGTPEFSKKDLRKALYLYNVATDDKKHIYKQQFLAIYNWLQENDSKELEGMEQALKLIQKEQ